MLILLPVFQPRIVASFYNHNIFRRLTATILKNLFKITNGRGVREESRRSRR